MKRVLFLLFPVFLFFFFTTDVKAQASSNFFSCAWENTFGACGVGSESCDESLGESTNPSLCISLTSQGTAVCNSASFPCTAPAGLINKYTCNWDPVGRVCNTVSNCASGYQPGGGCQSLTATTCSSTSIFSCVPTTTIPPADDGTPGDGTVIPASELVSQGCEEGEGWVNTAIGCIPLNNVPEMTKFFLTWAIGIAGGIALLLIGFAAFRITTSQGDPRRLQGGQELLLSAIGGLIMVVLSVYLLRFIGVNLLGFF